MSAFLNIPNEIADLIIEELLYDDLLHFRQVCKKADAWTSPHFVETFFRTRRVMLEQGSLDAIDSISRHPKFALAVEAVTICATHLIPLDELPHIEPVLVPGEIHEIENGHRLSRLDAKAYSVQFSKQERLAMSDFPTARLTKVMRRLRQCKTVRIGNSIPWGWNQLAQTIGVVPHRTLTFDSQTSIRFMKRILHTVLTAVAASKLHVETLQIGAGFIMGRGNCISPTMFAGLDITPLTRVRHLSIVFSLDLFGDRDPVEPGAWASDLNRFIQQLPELSKLRIEFETLDDASCFSKICSALHAPKLESLTLGSITCTTTEMASLLLRHQTTLQHISFENVRLIDGTDVSAWHWLVQVIHSSLPHIAYFGMFASDIGVDSGNYGLGIPDPLETTETQTLADILDALSTA